MPYELAVPDHVKVLDEPGRRKWAFYYNKSEEAKIAPEVCIDIADRVVAKSVDTFTPANPLSAMALLDQVIDKVEKSYQYVDSYDYQERCLTQEEAGYDATGGKAGKACSNCKFFISPARCTMVKGEIAPNGVSSMWKAIVPYVPAPLPVIIVGGGMFMDGDKSASDVAGAPPTTQGVLGAIASAYQTFKAAIVGKPGPVIKASDLDVMCMVKQADGRVRWITRYSNAWKDRDDEIICEASHKAFLERAEKAGTFPELWLWHTPGTRFGQADWLDFADGFALASGLVDDTKEALAVVDSLHEMQKSGKELGVSHGFFCKQVGNIITEHHTFEISVLPLDRAAVWTTDFNLLQLDKESEMALTPERRAFLETTMGKDKVDLFEKNTESAAASLKALGVDYKEFGEAETPTVDPAVAAAAAAAAVAVKATNELSLAALQASQKATMEEVARIGHLVTATVAGLGVVKSVAEKSRDEAVTDELVARIEKAVGGKGFSATGADGNVLTEAQKAAAAAVAGVAGAASGDPFAVIIAQSFGGAFGAPAAPAAGGVGTPAVAGVSVTGA